MEALDRFIRDDRFASHNGIEVVDYGQGHAKAQVTIGPGHLNSAGIVHGALIFALADAAFSAASNSHGRLALAINAHISFFKATKTGILCAEAREVPLNPKLATYAIPVKNQDDETIALFQGTVYRKSVRIDNGDVSGNSVSRRQ